MPPALLAKRAPPWRLPCIQESTTEPETLPMASMPMPPTCSMLTLLSVKPIDRSAPAATMLMPSPSWPLPTMMKLESVRLLTLTPGPATISMTGLPPVTWDRILAPPRSMPIGPWLDPVR